MFILKLFLKKWQAKSKNGTGADFALHRDMASMQLGDVTHES
jgi:hypothetical protein